MLQVNDEELAENGLVRTCDDRSVTCDVTDEAVQTSTGQENENPNPLPGNVAPIRDIWFFVPPKKKWLRQEVSVTEVTCNQVTVTFLESTSREGFFKSPAASSPVAVDYGCRDSAAPEQLPPTQTKQLEMKSQDS